MSRIKVLPDRELRNADWTKAGWDLPVNSVQELRQWLAQRRISVAHFKTLPIYQLNVDRLPWLREL